MYTEKLQTLSLSVASKPGSTVEEMGVCGLWRSHHRKMSSNERTVGKLFNTVGCIEYHFFVRSQVSGEIVFLNFDLKHLCNRKLAVLNEVSSRRKVGMLLSNQRKNFELKMKVGVIMKCTFAIVHSADFFSLEKSFAQILFDAWTPYRFVKPFHIPVLYKRYHLPIKIMYAEEKYMQ